jgi:hypothetical protein
MPDIKNLPTYEKIYYKYYHKIVLPLIFHSDTMLLVVTYNETIYDLEKSKIDNYIYLNQRIFKKYENIDEITYLLPEPEFKINSFHFRVLEANQDNNFDYPHYIGIIATSDEKKSIAYLYFEDQDLDYISIDKTEDEMVKFVKEYYRYKW